MTDTPETPDYAPSPESALPESDELTLLRSQLADAESRASTARDAQLRAIAELDNVRKRAEREIANGARYGSERLLADLLGVCDSLELGLKAAQQAAQQADASGADKLVEGMQLTQQQLQQVLSKHGVVELVPVGQPFDPNLHEAMTMVPSAQLPPNHVIEVLQKGYRLHERLLRPAMVVVSRAAG